MGSKKTTYTYDDLGQLIREYDGKFTKNFTYDDAGNITSIKVTWYSSVSGEIMSYAVTPSLPRPIITTTTLSYTDSEWGDLLTSFNGTTITYDEIGNPLSYYNGSAYTFTWEGRRLVGATKGSKTMSFTYDYNGIRTSKTVNGVKHTYHLNGSQIIAEEWNGALIIYLYDSAGSPIGMMYRTTNYDFNVFDVFYFEKNLQGDIVAVYDETGTKVATYNYTDAWGNHTVSYTNGGASTGAAYNPFRYRGYYYDTDLELYYLQSRYYDAKICRFINADGYVSTGQGLTGYNMFAYCGNNPVMRVDPTGEAWYNDLYDLVNTVVGLRNSASKITLAGAIITAVIQGNWSGLAHDIASGALNPFNQDEQIALESEVAGFYKGETVIRHSIPNTTSAQILGTIFLNSSEGYTKGGIDTLNHEWGHGVQERILGTGAYLLCVGAPSAYYCYYGGYISAPGSLGEKMYYSKIWERTADWLGGVNRNNYYDFWYIDNFIFWK